LGKNKFLNPACTILTCELPGGTQPSTWAIGGTRIFFRDRKRKSTFRQRWSQGGIAPKPCLVTELVALAALGRDP